MNGLEVVARCEEPRSGRDARGGRPVEMAGERIVALAKLVGETAFQPIVEIETGQVFGFEALFRGHDRLGLTSPIEVFDIAAAGGEVVALERMVQRRAIDRFAAIEVPGAKVFVNLDHRALVDGAAIVEALVESSRRVGLAPSDVVIELSEKLDYTSDPAFSSFLKRVRSVGFQMALDDFGMGSSELRLLCDHGVDYIKIDRHFLTGIASDRRKRLFVATFTDLAHVLGIRVIAEGVETARDHRACRDLGCDMVQGWYVARPTTEISTLAPVYGHLRGRRGRPGGADGGDAALVRSELELVPPIAATARLEEVFEAFRLNPNRSFFPIVDGGGRPVGIIHERDLKSYIYSPFGRDLLRNKTSGFGLGHFLRSAPITDLHAGIGRMLDLFAHADDTDCLLLTENLTYLGALSAPALLKIMSEKQIRAAQDQNPLTELPGNVSIANWVGSMTPRGDAVRVLCYFDFDHFKPFNDRYGFRRGDEVIVLFATVMRRRFPDAFLGHIGGDDFFAGFEGVETAIVMERVRLALAEFARGVHDLYDPADRAAGGIAGVDRRGRPTGFPLMRCSAALLELAAGHVEEGLDHVVATISELKSRAKKSTDGLVLKSFPA